MAISASQRSCLIFRVLLAQQRVTIFLKLRQMRLTRWDLDRISCVELQNIGTPAMAGEGKGMASMVCEKVRESGGDAFKFHCIIHKKTHCTKTISRTTN